MLLELRRFGDSNTSHEAPGFPRSLSWDRPLPTLDGSVLGLVFGTHDTATAGQALAELRDKYRHIEIVGCSTAGEVMGETLSDDSLVVAIVRFDRTSIRVASEPIVAEPRRSGATVGSQLSRPGPDGRTLSAVMVFIDGLAADVDAVLDGLRSTVDPGVPISGGVAADALGFSRAWTTAEQGVLAEGGLSALGLYGPDVVVRHGAASGWRPFGPPRSVTRSRGSVVYELDGRPILDMYEDYLGDRTAELPSAALILPLQVTLPSGEDVVRTILSIDTANRSMTFAGPMPEASICSLMLGSSDRLIDGAARAARQLTTDGCGPRLAVAVSCVGRRLALGTETEDEIDAIARELGDTAEVLGFYSYGEIAPTPVSNAAIHNQTMTITTISERA